MRAGSSTRYFQVRIGRTSATIQTAATVPRKANGNRRSVGYEAYMEMLEETIEGLRKLEQEESK